MSRGPDGPRTKIKWNLLFHHQSESLQHQSYLSTSIVDISSLISFLPVCPFKFFFFF
jgi:hypothetical protein